MKKGAQGALNDDYHTETLAVLRNARAFRRVFYVPGWRHRAQPIRFCGKSNVFYGTQVPALIQKTLNLDFTLGAYGL